MIKAVVTGHSRGLGAALAHALLARGALVLGVARQAQPTRDASPASSLQQAALDLSDTTALAAWLQGGVMARFLTGARTALLINNAGMLAPVGRLGTQDAGTMRCTLQLNVTAPLLLSDAFVAATSAVPSRRVLHVSSGAGRRPYPGWSVYGASKAALDAHAVAVAQEEIPGLRIASVAPGVVDTAMQAQIREARAQDFPAVARFVALKHEGQLASPAQAAQQMVDYLLSDAFGRIAVADVRDLPCQS